jgi:hypothetical protein
MTPARGESERPRYAIGPLGDAIDVASLEEWLRAAVPGDRIVYAWGAVLRRDRRAVTRAAELGDAKRVQLNFRKVDGRGEWVATRLADRRAVAVPPAPPLPGETGRAPETAEDRVFRAIRRRVKLGVPMATDAELARECGLKDADQASYVLRKLKLAEAGHRRIRILNYGPRERRVAVIVATGGATVRRTL